MRIAAVTARRVAVPLTEPFEVSLGVIDTADTVFVRLETDTGLIGYGEGAATPFVTGETAQTVLGAIELFKPALLGASPYAVEPLHRAMDRLLVGNGSAKAAVDLALYDLLAKAAGLPLYRYLGGTDGVVETDMTIGLMAPAAMAARAGELVAAGYRQIKVKAGACDDQDRQAIRLIREAAPQAHLKVDANQGWNPAQALALLHYYTGFGVESVEQPVPYWDRDGLAWLRARSPIPVMADESCFTPHDAAALVRHQAVDQINIKLMKCGGIYPALQINAVAQAAGVSCMVGCMLESRLSIAAGMHLVAATANIVQADLDSFNDFDDSSLVTGEWRFTPPCLDLGEAPGIGLEPVF
ncbi:MAG: dipeptide epimerase [Bifidobacteriaceae bacterium]|jgi:L-alanine-DL-glutamate epimerase-like enolase superfamily enzyme|nr:dipeptide epimerase [Bifidobacteriaceae bacterium]